MSVGREITVVGEIPDLQTMAENVGKSRLFPGVTSVEAAFTLLLLAQSEGLHPIQAMRRFHIIEGRPSMRADAMQAEFQDDGGRVTWIESTTEVCTAEFTHPKFAPQPVTVSVTLKELIDSGVAITWEKNTQGKWESKLKTNYKRHPRQMLKARVISEGVRMVHPGVVVGIYTPEEARDFDEPSSPQPRVIEVEAHPVTTGPAPGLSSRAGINATFAPAKANGHYAPVGSASEGDPAEADEFDEARAKTWQAFATARAARFNTGWSSLATEQGYELTSEDLRAPVNHYRLTQAVAALAVDDGLVEAPAKRDNAWAAGVCKELFRGNPQWAADAAKRYLRTKLAECKRAVAKAATSEPPDDEPEPEPDDGAAEILRSEGGHDDE